jgi:TrpR-related protein YerC/YecD
MSGELLKDKEELYSALLSLSSLEECDDFFKDLCTEKEILSMIGRIKAAKMLKNGETYEQIIKKTDISSATLSRVSKALKSGKGYKKVL